MGLANARSLADVLIFPSPMQNRLRFKFLIPGSELTLQFFPVLRKKNFIAKQLFFYKIRHSDFSKQNGGRLVIKEGLIDKLAFLLYERQLISCLVLREPIIMHILTGGKPGCMPYFLAAIIGETEMTVLKQRSYNIDYGRVLVTLF